MDGIAYLDLLEQYVFAQIETSEQEIVSRVIFMLSFQLLSDWRFKWEIPWCLDWKGWTNTLATSKPRSLSTWFFPVGVH